MLSEMKGASRLDQLATKYLNTLTDIDLTKYLNEDEEIRVKQAYEYRDDLEKVVFDPLWSKGATIPWSGFRGNFEFRAHELTVWSGYKGHGKSAFISQCFDNFMAQGQKCFVISPEFRPEQVIKRMIHQRARNRHLTVEMLDKWFAWAEKRLWLYDAQRSLKSDTVIALCRYAYEELGVNHILIDSLMKCGMGPDDYAGQKSFVDRVQQVAHNFPVHIHLVAHARKSNDDETPPKMHSIKGTSEIVDMAENALIVWRNKLKEKAISLMDMSRMNEPDAVVICEAQRNAEGWIGTVPLFYEKSSMTFHEESQSCPI